MTARPSDRAALLREQQRVLSTDAPRMARLTMVPVVMVGLMITAVGVLVVLIGWSEAVSDGDDLAGAILVFGAGIAVAGLGLAGMRARAVLGCYRHLRYWRHVDRFDWARQLPPGEIDPALVTPYDLRDSAAGSARSEGLLRWQERMQRHYSQWSVLGAILGGVAVAVAVTVVLAPLVGAGTFGGVDAPARGAMTVLALATVVPVLAFFGLVYGADGLSRQRMLSGGALDHRAWSAVRPGDRAEADDAAVAPPLFASPAARAGWGLLWGLLLVASLVNAEPSARVGIAILAVAVLALGGAAYARRRRLHLVSLDEPDPTGPHARARRRIPVTVEDDGDGWVIRPDGGEPLRVVGSALRGAVVVSGPLALSQAWAVGTDQGPVVLAGAGVADLPIVRAARERGERSLPRS